MIDNAVLGVCSGCGSPIIGGRGIYVDGSRRPWHPDCHRNKTEAAPAAQNAPKRRGRPPKARPAEAPQQ